MDTKFLCPYCRSLLNLDGNIILTAETQKGKKGLVLLHQEVGNYSALHDPSFNLKKHEKVDFFCPVCHESLQYDKNKNLVKIIMKEENNESIILFSNIYGEKCTYVIQDKDMKSYGESVKKYTNPDWFLDT